MLYYVHDPMCSWCWAFKPTWQKIKKSLPKSVAVHSLLGGLAADTDQPMPEQMQLMLQQTWRRIATTVPGTVFNYAFWTENSPRRATYPACRAVIAAARQGPELEERMLIAIQHAYYLNAKNPSDDTVLLKLAQKIGCNMKRFNADLNGKTTASTLRQNIELAAELKVSGFPSLILERRSGTRNQITVNYNSASSILDMIDKILAA